MGDREIDQQDRVLRHQPHQQHQPDHREGVDRVPEHPEREDAAHDRERLRRHDDEGLQERIELAREHHVDERQRERQRELRQELKAQLSGSDDANVVGLRNRLEEGNWLLLVEIASGLEMPWTTLQSAKPKALVRLNDF